MSNEMMDALQALAGDRGISVDRLFGILANALESAYKRMPDAHEYAWVTIDPSTFDIRVFAQELDEEGEPYGPELDVTPANFGRIAAQTTKQILMQGIREVEREMKYEEYAGREGDIVTGIVQQTDARYTLLDLGRVEALMPQAEQVSYERAETGARLKAYIVEVRKTAKGPQIVVSRTHPGLVKRLFELEVPEIADGIVEIKACAREPGHRTKIAVWSNDQNVDPVGACVGARGSRVRMVVNELRGEKVDIVPFSDDPYDFVARALSPARVKEVRIHPETGTAEVIVPDYQLSLAIGKEGQNARLAHRLTGWRIDIKSETQLEEEALYAAQGYDDSEEWAEGEWVVDPETGEQVWQPAEGGPTLSAEEWASQDAEDAEDVDDGGDVDGGDDAGDVGGDDSGAVEAGDAPDDLLTDEPAPMVPADPAQDPAGPVIDTYEGEGDATEGSESVEGDDDVVEATEGPGIGPGDDGDHDGGSYDADLDDPDAEDERRDREEAVSDRPEGAAMEAGDLVLDDVSVEAPGDDGGIEQEQQGGPR